jgi:hypothetical protein
VGPWLKAHVRDPSKLARFAISLSGQLSLQNCAKKNRHRVFNQQYAWAKNAHVIQ